MRLNISWRDWRAVEDLFLNRFYLFQWSVRVEDTRAREIRVRSKHEVPYLYQRSELKTKLLDLYHKPSISIIEAKKKAYRFYVRRSYDADIDSLFFKRW